MNTPRFERLILEKIVGGGQALGRLESGKKAFVWGGLSGEDVTIRISKKKSGFVEGISDIFIFYFLYLKLYHTSDHK